MKKISSILRILLLCCMIGGTLSCKKDKDPAAPATQTNDTDQSAADEEFQARLAKKWEVQSIAASDQGRTTGGFDLPWFEFFAKDHKYVVHDNSTIHYGTYSTNAARDTIILNDFGIISIIELNDTAFDFYLKKDGETDVKTVFTTIVNPVIPSSPAADLLCDKAWMIDWQIYEDQDTTFYNSTSSGITKIEVRFSRNGTYLTQTETTDDFSGSAIVKYWKWNDADHTQFLTSDSNMFEEGGNTLILIHTLTANEWNFSYGTITKGSASR